MELSLFERLVILSILPGEGSYVTLRILQNLKLALSFTEEEIREWGIVSDKETNQTRWQQNGMADIPIGEKATDIIVEALSKLNKDKKLNEQMLGIYEKFIPEK
jgi:hypothetical protein